MRDNKTVLLGMSGGVDSSVAALLLKKKGYEVTGAFLKMYSDTKNPLNGRCTYLDDLKDARKIAAKLKIPLIVLDYEREYKKRVLALMFKSYASGNTPNPDLDCNTVIKFPYLWKEAKKRKINFIATGHYARIKRTPRGYSLLQGKDKQKDQSYFLAGLIQDDLSHTLFPLGDLRKEYVRKIAEKSGFHNWSKHGTVGICFVGQRSMHSFLKQKIKTKTGTVIDEEGNVLGEHAGISFYTIGQKAGAHVGIQMQKPKGYEQSRFYVAGKKKPNTLVVAPESHHSLIKKQVTLKKLHRIIPGEKIPSLLKGRIRHLGEMYQGKLLIKAGKIHFIFNKPIEAIAPGQYLVLYKGDSVIASGEMM
ncbi:tRNA 2-thiouridine(34) synthase MnmA [Candidatus Pacearchaeota archaeon]|nr:tRNA 2-thiouridine(34) synthase MnmA [Candidatus Pacearchaeota archaeon]